MNHRDGNTPMTDEGRTEQQIQAAGKTAPRITPDRINSVIASKHFFTAADGATDPAAVNDVTDDATFRTLGLLTFCVLVLRNGFTVTGESACASPENFDPQIGRDIAERNARDKIWALEGYLLRQRLHEAQPSVQELVQETRGVERSQPGEIGN